MRRAFILLVAACVIAFGFCAGVAVAGLKKDVVSAQKQAPSKKTASKKTAKDPQLHSASVLVTDPANGKVLYEKNANAVVPIASITKLMTAMVVLDAKQDMSEKLAITKEDLDTIKHTGSRLTVGTKLSRKDMLRLALMSSENRAASALSRHYPGGCKAFIAAMNKKARALKLQHTNFKEPTGLSSSNVSSAHDLAHMVTAAHRYSLIRKFTTTPEYTVSLNRKKELFRNTNKLVRKSNWDISLSKTGYIKEAGRCLVMQAKVANRPMIIVLLDSQGTMTRIGDANRIRNWIEHAHIKPNHNAS